MVFARNAQSSGIKRVVRLALIVMVVAAALFLTAAPALADTPEPVTITRLSGGSTLTAGYTYNNPYYEADYYASGTDTQTAGYTHTNPSAAPLNPASYGGAWTTASIIAEPNGAWANIGGAHWVSTTSVNSGVENPAESDTWRLFRATFNIADLGAVTAASIQIATDNAYECYLNGTLVANTANWSPTATVYGASPEPGGTMRPFGQVTAYPLTPQAGDNTLMFVVRNWDNLGQDNPSGLNYKVMVQHAITAQQLNPSVYSGGGVWTHAPLVTSCPSAWVQSEGGAPWISTTADYSGTDNDYQGDAWRLYMDQFTIPDDVTIDTAIIQVAADNAYEVYFNGTLIATTATWNPAATIYDNTPEPGGTMLPFEQVSTTVLNPHTGPNTLMFVVRNWENGDSSNPTGLRYAASITYEASASPAPFVSVGGDVFRVDKFQLLLPWLAAGAGLLAVLFLGVNRLLGGKKQRVPNRER